MDKQILDRIKKSEQRVVDLYGKVRDLNTTVYGLGGKQGLKEHYTILQIDADLEIGDGDNYIWSSKERGKALVKLYNELANKDGGEYYGGDYRHTILLPPGYYYFPEGAIEMHARGINLMSLTGEADVIFEVSYEGDAFSFNQLGSVYYNTPSKLDTLTFLNVGNNILGQNFGIDSEGIYFNNANQDGESYPVRFPDSISTGSEGLYYSVDFIHEHRCSDIGFAIWENGEQPEWDWESSINTLFKVQIDCEGPLQVFGNGVDSYMNIPGGMIVGNKYQLRVDMIPGDLAFVALVDLTMGEWIVYNWFYGSYPINQGIDIRAGFAADSDNNIMHIIAIQGPQPITQFTPCLIVDANDVTVKGIVGYNTGSTNWYNWAEAVDSSYNFPIFVGQNCENVTLENCIGGPFSFGADPYYDGNGIYYNNNYKFINCRAPQGFSFGYGVGNYDVTAIGCNSLSMNNQYYSSNCFNIDGDFYGTYKDCTVGDNSFVAYELNINAINCTAGQDSFRGHNFLDGNFENCRAGNYSFRSNNGSIYGTYRNCIVDGSSIFYADINVYANFYNCWFYDAQNLNGTSANCYYCINYDGNMIGVNYALYCLNITD